MSTTNLPLKVCLIGGLIFNLFFANSQTTIYADAIVSSLETDNAAFAIDPNQSTFSEIRAHSGALLGIGAYSGYQEVQFSSGMVPANQTTFIKIDCDDNILESLLGGSIGNLLATVGGLALVGNQEFVVEAKQNGTTVLSGNSANPVDFSGESLKIVVNQFSETFIAITPTMDYNSIRITNHVGSLIGLSTTKTLRLYSAHYVVDAPPCNYPTYTSYDASGLTVDLIQLTGAGATNIHRTIDQDMMSYSELSLGTVSTPAYIEQKAYFEGVSSPVDIFGVRFQVSPELALLNLATNIRIRAQQGTVVIYDEPLGNIITPQMLDSLVNGDIVTLYFQPNLPVDRVILHLDAFLGLNIDQFLNFHEVFKIPPPPVYDLSTSTTTICEGLNADLMVNTNDTTMYINWYSDSLLTNLVGTSPQGSFFTTGALNADTTFYVTAFHMGCNDETAPVAVPVSVLNAPDASDISISGPATACAIEDIELVPSSSSGSNFMWYFNNDLNDTIPNGVVAGVIYNTDANGALSISNIDTINSPYTYYVAMQDPVTLCWSAPGNLASFTITIEDEPAPTSSMSSQGFCQNDNPTIADLQINGSVINWYDETGQSLSTSTPLLNNTTYYATQQGAVCESSDSLAILAVVLGTDDANITPSTDAICFGDTVYYSTQPGMTLYDWDVNGGLVISGGTSSDSSIAVVWQSGQSTSIEVSFTAGGSCVISMLNALEVNPASCNGPDLGIEKTVDDENPFVGQQVVFTIEVTNYSSDNYTNVSVSEQLPSGFTYVSHTSTNGTYNPSSGNWDIPTLSGLSSAILEVTVIVNPSGNYLNVAIITSPVPGDVNPGNNSSEVEASPNCLTVYNEITPNSDGINDFLLIDCIEDYPNNSIQIFNRYGNPIYQVDGYSNDWDGIANVSGTLSKNEQVPTGTYFYILKIEEIDYEASGWVYVVR